MVKEYKVFVESIRSGTLRPLGSVKAESMEKAHAKVCRVFKAPRGFVLRVKAPTSWYDTMLANRRANHV